MTDRNLILILTVVVGMILIAAGCQAGLDAGKTPNGSALAPDTIAGVVVDQAGKPVAEAVVRVQATNRATTSDAQGRFSLSGLETGKAVNISAWKQLYYCARQESVAPPSGNVRLTLRLYQTNDNPNYEWVLPVGDNSCFSCKPGITQVWLDNDAHGKSAVNPRFLTMYNGTDVKGNHSPPNRFNSYADLLSWRSPLSPDPSQPYYGPGFKLDYQDIAGECALCHVPGLALNNLYDADPNRASGVDKFGIHCDFCHKIAEVRMQPPGRIPYLSMPGVMSMDVRRPFPEDKERYQLFFGTFDDDNVPEEDANLPLLAESRFCAPCHTYISWDVTIYNSYGEWLDSPYSDPKTGMTCQKCHMPSPTVWNGQPITNPAPGKGGVERDPNTIHAHTFPGAASRELLENSLTMSVSTRRVGEQLEVEVNLTNDKTGHHIPTDSPLRQMILLVEPTSADGSVLPLLEGEKVPQWGGVGDPQKGYYAGLPGKAFAKVLEELGTEISPSVSYWNPIRLVSDNRLAAFASDTSRYVFKAPAAGSLKVNVRLWYRRAFRYIADLKGWNDPDILMEKSELVIQ